MDRQIGRIHRSASCGHQTAGAVPLCFNDGIGNIDRCRFPIGKYTIGMGSVGFNQRICDGQGATIGRKDRRVFSIEISFISIRFPCLGYADIGIGLLLSIYFNGMLAIFLIFISILDGNILFGQIGRSTLCVFLFCLFSNCLCTGTRCYSRAAHAQCHRKCQHFLSHVVSSISSDASIRILA